ncbi:hypothetical protein J8J40_26025, partial [Mycobacterium tuberculosis]|nr:hypothetical protein [Mycobacterium tuberculosis]
MARAQSAPGTSEAERPAPTATAAAAIVVRHAAVLMDLGRYGDAAADALAAVWYTHLTLPTINRV